MMLFIWYCQYLSIVASGLMQIKVVMGFSVWYICLMMPWKWESKCTVRSIYHVSKSLRVFITNINNPDKYKMLEWTTVGLHLTAFQFAILFSVFCLGKNTAPLLTEIKCCQSQHGSVTLLLCGWSFCTVRLKCQSPFLSKNKKQNLCYA